MSDKKRTMAEADRASSLRFSIGATIIIGFICLICYFPVPHTFFLDWHHNAQSWTKNLAVIPFALALWMVYGAHNATVNEKSSGGYWILVLLLVALGIGVSSGFVFDLK